MSVRNPDIADIIQPLYRNDQIQEQCARYEKLIRKFNNLFQTDDYHLFSTPGRTEIGGNHTDHNHGRVLAASIDLDIIAVAASSANDRITVHSEGYDQHFEIDLTSLERRADETGTTAALIRGMAAGFSENGFHTGGFKACLHSQVLPGSGLSSSAAIEMLLATIINVFFNKSQVMPEMLAKIGQQAENKYFDKPCGLMDQMACAIGGIISIDFEIPSKPKVEKITVDFDQFDYALLVVNTGGSHADLTEDYAAVPKEMKKVANALGKNVCRELTMDSFISAISRLRLDLSDRALLRAYHFLGENERVLDQIKALKSRNFQLFLSLINQSGLSSFRWLQNIYPSMNTSDQSLTLALALTEHFLNYSGKGACRVHGGGFAGTIQVFLPPDMISDYIALMRPVFGPESVTVLRIRKEGSTCLTQP